MIYSLSPRKSLAILWNIFQRRNVGTYLNGRSFFYCKFGRIHTKLDRYVIYVSGGIGNQNDLLRNQRFIHTNFKTGIKSTSDGYFTY